MSPISVHDCTLNTGAKMPAVGMGCWMGTPVEGMNQETFDMVSEALKVGYRHIDTAGGYGNEEAVGAAIRASGIPREEIFVTTKLPNEKHHAVKESFEGQVKKLNIEYVDLYLMHWPIGVIDGKTTPIDQSPTYNECWSEMEKLLEGGKVKAIGVSNFSVKNMKTLLEGAKVVPAVNQVESHPYLPQLSIDAFCQKKGIILTAYSPLGQPREGKKVSPLIIDEKVVELAKKYDVGPGTILISWIAQRPGWNVIPKSANPKRMRDNFEVCHVPLAVSLNELTYFIDHQA